MRQIVAVASGVAIVWCAPARAGEDVQYGPAPEWAAVADMSQVAATPSPLLLLDKQTRLEDGVVVAYSDVAFRIDSPDAGAGGNRLVVGQWKQHGSQSPFLAQRFKGGAFHLTLEQATASPGQQCRVLVAWQDGYDFSDFPAGTPRTQGADSHGR